MSKLGKFIEIFIHSTANQIDDVTSMLQTSRGTWLFREGERSTIIGVEMLVEHPWLVIDTASIDKWLPPHNQEAMSQQQKAHIVAKVCKYFDDRGESYTVN